MTDKWTTAAILGVVEGLTEFLPVSSTGHLLLAESLLSAQSDLFNVVVQSGAVLAVLVVFSGRLRQLWRDRRTKAARATVLQLSAAFAMTAAGGLVMKACRVRLPAEVLPVALATLIGGVVFVVVEAVLARRAQPERPIGWAGAALMGAGQLLAAMLPGTSRSGATILLARMAGAGRREATEFSFLLGVPTLLSAGGLELVQAARDPTTHVDPGPLLLATLTAAAVAFVTVRWLLGYVRHHSFAGFGWYRIGLGLMMLSRPWWGG